MAILYANGYELGTTLAAPNTIQMLSSSQRMAYFQQHIGSTQVAIRNSFFVIQKDIIVWKKGRIIKRNNDYGYALIELKIPAGTDVYVGGHGFYTPNIKCRASNAKVVSIQNNYGTEINSCISLRNSHFTYEVGSIVMPNYPFSFEYEECDAGIHFFLDRQEAIRYVL